jgi:hypothetical protein
LIFAFVAKQFLFDLLHCLLFLFVGLYRYFLLKTVIDSRNLFWRVFKYFFSK